MIKSFRHRGLEQFYINDNARLLNPQHLNRIKLLLDLLDAAESIQGLNITGSHLHQLKGDRKGTWSLRASGNWRLTFSIRDGYDFDVDLEDYH